MPPPDVWKFPLCFTKHWPFRVAALISLHFFTGSLLAEHPIPLTMCDPWMTSSGLKCSLWELIIVISSIESDHSGLNSDSQFKFSLSHLKTTLIPDLIWALGPPNQTLNASASKCLISAPLFYMTLALWGRSPALTPLPQLITQAGNWAPLTICDPWMTFICIFSLLWNWFSVIYIWWFFCENKLITFSAMWTESENI